MIPFALLGLAAAAVSDPPAEGPEVYAVIVGHNASEDGALPDLAYADDDAARYHEILSATGGRVVLLSVLDADTQRLHPEVAATARPPRRSELEEALDATFDAIRRARDAGRRTVFYFVYVGHGSLGEDGEGQMHLLGGRFSRSDLFQRVIARSPATVNHIVIDACHAYLMVARRGQASEVDAALERFLAREDLAAYPNTGVLLSTSEAAEVHEWERFSAGIFSHEVRSAWVGGADVDGDGRATYDEVRAFIAAANARIDHPRARLDVYAAPPRINIREPVFDRSWVQRSVTLRVPGRLAGRYYLEDGRGVRYADFHSSPGFEVTMTLLPQDVYFLRGEGFEVPIPSSVLRSIDVGTLKRRRSKLAARGSESLAFQRHLFALPFGPSYFEGYRASLPDSAGPERVLRLDRSSGRSARTVAGVAAAGLGVASLVASLVMALDAEALARDYERAIGSDDDIAELRGRIDDRVLARNLLLGAGIGLAVTGATLLLWPDRSR